MNKKQPASSKAISIIKKRTVIFSAFFVLVCIGLVGRLAKLQIIDYQDYQVKAATQQLHDEQIAPARGAIYDTNMKTLAASIQVYTIVVSPEEIEEKDREAVAEGLAGILELEKEDIMMRLAKEGSYYEVLRYKVEKPIANDVISFATEKQIGGIYLFQDSRRFYPYGNFASTVLGFTGRDNTGLAGLESYYDETLTGTFGRKISAKNAWGFDIDFKDEANYDAQDGHSLVLTLDETIQNTLEKNLAYAVQEHNVAQRGVGIVMDVNTGAILAMAVKPDYDPNKPFDIQDPALAELVDSIFDDPATEDIDEQANALSEAQQFQWRNKAVSDLYEPGSVFKLVTASAGLDSGSASLSSGYLCTGAVTVADTTLHCANLAGHGAESFSQALINSCNPAFISIASGLGSNRFYDYFNSFGFTQKTGVDLPGEAQSQFYTADELGPVQLASCSFGQSNKISPIQMITAVCATVNGGYLVRPHIVDKVLDENGNIVSAADTTPRRQVISAETSASIATVMEEAVSNGPCNNAYVLGYRVGGKSGTSQKLDQDNEDAWIASFVGIAPADNPQIAVLVFLDEPYSYSIYGGVLCAPVVAAVMADALPYLGVEPVYTDSEIATAEASVPNVTTQALDKAQVALQKRGFKAKIVGNGSTVIQQSPSGGQAAPRGSTVILYTESGTDNMVTVPNFIDKSPSAASTLAQNANINMKRSGTSSDGASVVAVSQSLEAGTQVPAGTVITVEFRDKNARDE